jgi:Protein of unknown function (DUF3800)
MNLCALWGGALNRTEAGGTRVSSWALGMHGGNFGEFSLYAFVDETGNTGAKLLDNDQPLFVTAALLTRSDFDRRFGRQVDAIAASLGVDEIHASELGVARLEEIASALLKVVRKAGPAFFLARVEKRYVLAAKIFDTIFDSAENRAVPWHAYNARPLRLMLVFKIASVLDDALSQAFWDALMTKRSDQARAKMADFCRALRGRVGLIPDQRSRQVVGEALDWAAANPEALEFVHQTKQGRKSHLPNMVGFGNLLSGIERQSNVWGRPVEVIRHDRQHEFEQALKFWHQMYSNAREDVVHLPLGEKMVLRKVFGSRLEISSARDSAGIQVIDVILWLFARSLRGHVLPDRCQGLLDYVYSRAYQDDFSFSGVGAAATEMIEDIETRSLPPSMLDDGQALFAEIEKRRLDEMEAYARAKTPAE